MPAHVEVEGDVGFQSKCSEEFDANNGDCPGPKDVGQALASVEEALMSVNQAFGSPVRPNDEEEEESQYFLAKTPSPKAPPRKLSTEETVHFTMAVPQVPLEKTEVSFRIKLDSPAVVRKEYTSVSRKSSSESQKSNMEPLVEEEVSVGLRLKGEEASDKPDVVKSTMDNFVMPKIPAKVDESSIPKRKPRVGNVNVKPARLPESVCEISNKKDEDSKSEMFAKSETPEKQSKIITSESIKEKKLEVIDALNNKLLFKIAAIIAIVLTFYYICKC